jgi:hypothetical protein
MMKRGTMRYVVYLRSACGAATRRPFGRLVGFGVMIVLGGGCDWVLGKQISSEYCAAHPADDRCPPTDVGPDVPKSCTSSAECSPEVCDVTGTMTCVQCTPAEDAACTGTTPACVSNACAACTSHAQCDSAACLPDGSCAAETQVAYVDPNGTDNSTCNKAVPCTKVDKALATGRAYVKLTGTTDEGNVVTIDNRNVSILAEKTAKLIRTSNGVILEVKGTSQVAIYDLEISGASGAGVGLSMPAGNTATVALHRVKLQNNAAGGISASGGTLAVTQSTISGNAGGGISASGGTLTVRQSTISGNAAGGISASGGSLTVSQSSILLNGGGGVSINNGAFDLTNNIISKNGGPGSTFGGVVLSSTNGGMRRFEFNTVAQNQATTGITPGVTCALVATPINLSNSIVFGNGASTQVEGTNCAWTFSDVGPVTVSGTGNINADPMFVNAMQNNFNIMTGSPCKDAADPASSLAVDVDGESRPQGPRRDIGADEVP